MFERGIKGSFASGGITSYLVDMLERGLFRVLLDVQCFDLTAVDSFRRNAAHREMSASLYANPAMPRRASGTTRSTPARAGTTTRRWTCSSPS